MERVKGFEPSTSCLGSKHSAAELHPPRCIYCISKVCECKEGVPFSSLFAWLESVVSWSLLLEEQSG